MKWITIGLTEEGFLFQSKPYIYTNKNSQVDFEEEEESPESPLLFEGTGDKQSASDPSSNDEVGLAMLVGIAAGVVMTVAVVIVIIRLRYKRRTYIPLSR